MTADPATDIPQFTLLVSEKGGAERRQAFRAAEITLGRVQGNDLVLPKGNVSKRHARILYREGRFIVADLNSTNGTYVNRRRIAQATIIREDDRVYVGDFVIRVIDLNDGPADIGPPTPKALLDTSDTHTLKPESAEPVPGARVSSRLVATASDVSASTHAASTSTSSVPAGPESLDEPAQSPPNLRTTQASAGAPTRTSSAPPSAPRQPSENPGESTGQGQRFNDMASGHRQAVAATVRAVLREIELPEPNPSDEVRRAVHEQVELAVDALHVEGQIPMGTSAEAVAEQASWELLGLGPLGELLEDPAVSSISAARFDDLTGTRDGRQQAFPPGFSQAATFELALRRLCSLGPEHGEEPVIERTLPDGTRVSLIRGSVSPDGPLLSIRKPRRITSSLDDLVRRGAISRAMATFLGQCVAGRLNILVVGPRDEGAHIVLSALCASAAHERIVAATEFDDVAAHNDSAVRLDLSQFHGQARRLFEIASQIPQTRLAVTLSNPEISAATLEATGAGMSGLLAALHAANLARGLLRLPADIVSERSGMSLEAATGWLLSAFDVVVEVTRLRDGRVRVLRIGELGAGEQGGVHVTDIFRFAVSRVAAGGAVEGSFTPSGQTPRVAGQLQALGMRVDSTLFVRTTSRP